MKRQMILGALLVGCLWSCNQAATKTDSADQTQSQTSSVGGTVGKLEDQVMALHNKTMQDLDSVMALKKQLKAIATRAVITGPDNDSIDANLHRLQKSDDDMMDWMNSYAEPDKKMAEDKATTYLNDQLAKIQKIYTDMQHNMQYASAFVKIKR